MTDDTWPDLSGWYPLPEGCTIPKGTRYAWRDGRGGIHVCTAEVGDFTPPGASPYPFRTERPVPVPLPTEEGARIIAYVPWYGTLELTLTDGEWRSPGGSSYDDDDITRWMPATEWRGR